MRRRKSIVEHWVYFSCHGLQWDAFDPYRSRWMHLPTIPQDDCFMCSDKESLAVRTDLLVFGKVVHSHVVLRYNLLSNSWSSGKDMNMPRCLFGSASLGEIAIVAGGCSSFGTVYASAELYNSEEGAAASAPSTRPPSCTTLRTRRAGRASAIYASAQGQWRPSRAAAVVVASAP